MYPRRVLSLSCMQLELARCYETGRGCTKSTERSAFWFLKAAQKGNGDAQHEIAWRYANGEGVAEDQAKATQWFLKATEQNVPNSFFAMG
jgi:TPR repeat protein